MDEPTSTSAALALYVGTTQRDRAAAWAALPADERRRAAMAAANSRDSGELADLTVAYLLLHGRQHSAASDHTLRSYSVGVRSLLRSWSQENLLHPAADAGDRYIAELSRTLSPASCASRLAGALALYRALNWARATREQPFIGVHAPANRTPRHERRHPYSDAQVEAIAAAADPRLRLLILLTAHGGLRIAEALDLQWPDVRLSAGTLRVLRGKGRKARTVHISGTLLAALTEACESALEWVPHVVTKETGDSATDASWLRRRLAGACARAGVEYLGWHAFRHTAGTRLARETGNLQLVAAHLGHSDVSTAAIYAKWSDTALSDSVSRW